MSQHLRVRPRPAAMAIPLVISTFLLAACGGAGAGPSGGASVDGLATPAASAAVPSASATMTASSPRPTDLQQMPIGFLPQASIDPATVETACEDVAGAALSCADAVTLAARMAVTMTGANPVEQVLVERSTEDSNLVTITFWALDAETAEPAAFTSTVDVAAGLITFPSENPDALFPAS